MKLMKITYFLFIALSLAAVTPVYAAEAPVTKTETAKEVRAEQIESRLIEIRNLAKTNLTAHEKKELRKEVKSLKKEGNHGIYLSIGAIIIIIILLLILLL
jgi:hypothetical protein